ncbi:hypothetical protein [Pseudoclavibacter endophyticus]|uniref:Uncharacterized protein n=1 Tax=Pseudoclavibacter endophyticus TaxID=1778590 RepID=A0A6H9WLV0_9MICO|nr:hypothetical protein [Pseudoclavibacter endophyticus]KAB1649038.1 hypothetical protein F8O04_01770 [Pseudoclavibacter endophyticus]
MNEKPFGNDRPDAVPGDALETGDALDPEADGPLELAEMAALMRTQQRAARGGTARIVSLLLLTWGVVWFTGFLVLWSGVRGGNPWFTIASPIDSIAFGGLMIVGVAASITMGARLGRGVRGGSATSDTMYGLAWMVAMAGATATLTALIGHGLAPESITLVAPSIYVSTAGLMYLVGAAIWRSWATFGLGSCVIAIACVATFIGAPHHLLAYAIGSIVVLPVFAWLSWRGMMRGTDPTRPGSGPRASET